MKVRTLLDNYIQTTLLNGIVFLGTGLCSLLLIILGIFDGNLLLPLLNIFSILFVIVGGVAVSLSLFIKHTKSLEIDPNLK